MYLLDFNERGDEIFRQWYVDGSLNVEAVYDNDNIREGIQKLQVLSPFNFHQFIDPTTGQKKYFYGDFTNNGNHQRLNDPAAIFYDEQITTINSGISSMDKKCYVSHLNKAMKAINQLTLIEDSLVIFRITRSPEKRVFYVATGNLPKPKAEEYMRSLITKYRQKKVYNTDLGTIQDNNKTVSILEDFWFPIDKNGVGSKVETIAGQTPNFGGFDDVDYFVGKVYKALNIPENRRSKDTRLTEGNNIDIEKDELKFFKFILKLRRKFNNLFVDLLKKDLLAQNVMTIDDWNIIQERIKFTYANSNEYTEIKNNQVLGMRVDAANTATSLVEGGYLSLEYIQKKILRLTDEEISEIKEQNAMVAAETGGADDFDEEAFGPDHVVRRASPPSGGGGMGRRNTGGIKPPDAKDGEPVGGPDNGKTPAAPGAPTPPKPTS
jgi:hypothetical protein